MHESRGGEMWPFMIRASSSRNTFGIAVHCTVTCLEPLPPPVAKAGDDVFVTRSSKVTAVSRETTDDS